MSGNEILTSINGHKSVINKLKKCQLPSESQSRTCQYGCIYKVGQIVSICSKHIERKRNSDINQGP